MMRYNEYLLSIVQLTRHHVFFDFFVNGAQANTDGYMCLTIEEFDRLYRDLFRSSRGRCVKSYSTNPPTGFYF